MRLTCPLCGLSGISSEWHLRKHLEGRSGLHGLSPRDADRAVAQAVQKAQQGDATPTAPVTPPEESPRLAVPTRQVTARPSQANGTFVHDLFAQLAAHKPLPKYQFERRIDAIIAIFLPEILEQCLGWHVEVVVPEFPLKKAGNNQSTNVDYLLFRHGNQTAPQAWVFFELKTDRDSLRSEQWNVYVEAAARGMPALRADLRAIATATAKRGKYRELEMRLDERMTACPIEVLYLSPGAGAVPGLPSCVRVLSFAQLTEVRSQRYPEEWELFKQIVLPALR